MSTPQHYHCQRHNHLITLTEELAHSGEAKVWRTDQKGYLAKIYHDPHNERIQKLQVMVRHIPSDPNARQSHISFAWPYSVLEDEAGEIVGFLMSEVVGSETLLKICTPQLRRKFKLRVDWYFLHVVARNVAGIIQAIHQEGYVLGDIKLENILVNNRALPTIIDTDSFQVPDPYSNTIHRCLVGSEGFTPAELIGVDIASVDQTEVHDRFRLGVVIYYLLFSGPPFRGLWQGSGDAPEQSELIRRGLWPFSSDSLILPSPTTMPLEILHPRLQALFLDCFNNGHQFPHKRPTAGDWLEALEVSLNEVVSCGKVDSHYYSVSYGHCYWCERAKALNFDLFPGRTIITPKPKPVPVPPQEPSTPSGVGEKSSSLPKIVVPPKSPLQLLTWRKVLLELGAVIIIATGWSIVAQGQKWLQRLVWIASGAVIVKILAQPRSNRLVFTAITPFTEQLPNGISLEMVGLPGGTFLMGSPKSDPDARDNEFPQHEVTVPSFAIGKYPVTQAQWQSVMGSNPSRFDSDPQNPVEQVSWDDCQDFCKKLSKLTGKTYRLPSEAEWEYACRAGTTTRYFFGDEASQLGEYAWYGDNYGDSTHSVGQKKPNLWGLYDMHGNVWEWCEDGWHDNYEGAPTDDSAWTDNHLQVGRRVLRGGSWYNVSKDCRFANRGNRNRADRSCTFGLRLVYVSSFD